MDNTKIPWIECVITLPEKVEEHFNNLIKIYKKKSRTKKKLKKKMCRLTTDKLLKQETNNIVPISDENMIEQLGSLICNSQKMSLKLENKIIDYIDSIIKKYMSVYIHAEDKTLLMSEKNKSNDKIFLKFYFPKIVSDNENNIQIDKTKNKFGDNIHFTVLPEIFGHGTEGMFHLTFRIESKTGKPIYEYSKYVSFNIDNGKVAIVLYDDEHGNNAVVFRISNNFDNLNNLLIQMTNFTSGEFDEFINEESVNTKVYKDICLYIALDIFKKLFESKKIDNFFTRYLNSFGLETIYKMINKLLTILLSTFLDMYSNKL
jgi:hypothetical protein